MSRVPTLWKANTIAFISSFCVMVIELIASRILAPHIGVSLYTWTSIIGVILAGIAMGNYLGGKLADRRPSPLVLAAIFVAGSLLTITILPATKMVTSTDWFGNLPVMWNFTLKTFFIFFLPAIVLSMVSPMVIKLTLADLGQTGGIVGTIYAFSTAGAILGTFMTGFYFILWFGTKMIVWLVAAVLFSTGIIAWFSWKIPDRWRFSLKNFIIWIVIIEIAVTSTFFFQFREFWQEDYVRGLVASRESNYFTIKVYQGDENVRLLKLDNMIHSYTKLGDPTVLVYDYVNMLEGIVGYVTREKPPPRILHLGGGGYTFPRYMETVYPESINDVVEIDPAVTQVAHEELGLPPDTSVKTYNQDARLFLIQRKTGDRYNIVIGDVFNDQATPYHLTTLEFTQLVKANMTKDGIYMINLTDDYQQGRYLPSFVYTLQHVFNHVYLFSADENQERIRIADFVIIATDHPTDRASYDKFVTEDRTRKVYGHPLTEIELEEYLAERDPVLLTDDYAPTDIFVRINFR